MKSFEAGVAVKPAEVRDIPFISDTEKLIFSDAWSPVSVEKFVTGDTSVSFVVFSENNPAGYILATSVPGEGEILRVAVLPEYRKSGLGRILLGSAVEKLLSEGAEAVFLEVRADNTPALSLYSSFGFQSIATRRSYYRNPTCDAVIMKLGADNILHLHNTQQ